MATRRRAAPARPPETPTADVDELALYHRNPRRGNLAVIEESLLSNSQYKPLTINVGTHTGRPNEVLAGNHTLIAMRALRERHPDDERWRRVLVHYIDVDDDAVRRIVLVDNRAGQLGGFDEELLASLVAESSSVDDLLGTGYDEDDLTALLHDATIDDSLVDRDYEEGNRAKPVTHATPFDMIFSSNSCCWSGALTAYAIGWLPGVISTYAASARRYLTNYPRTARPIAFIDNDWHGYDHAAHVAAVSEFTPRYATTRDLVTKSQAAASGVEFYDLAQTLDMAAEIAQHTDNVILIPKYDCLDKLPELIEGKRVVLGYSVTSGYGRTDLPATAFAGRPVHLLGGSWRNQRALLNVLGDDVVSLDQNQILKIAQYGASACGDGTVRNLSDLVVGVDSVVERSLDTSLALSLTLIMHAVRTEFGNTAVPDPAYTEELSFDGVEH